MFTKYFASGARHFLAYDSDTLVSHAVVTTRGVQPEGLPILRTAFVDAVSTLPSRQNQGYGSATMRRLAEGIGDYEIGCLQTDRTSFYAHLGWEEWRGPLAGRSDDGLIDLFHTRIADDPGGTVEAPPALGGHRLGCHSPSPDGGRTVLETRSTPRTLADLQRDGFAGVPGSASAASRRNVVVMLVRISLWRSLLPLRVPSMNQPTRLTCLVTV